VIPSHSLSPISYTDGSTAHTIRNTCPIQAPFDKISASRLAALIPDSVMYDCTPPSSTAQIFVHLRIRAAIGAGGNSRTVLSHSSTAIFNARTVSPGVLCSTCRIFSSLFCYCTTCVNSCASNLRPALIPVAYCPATKTTSCPTVNARAFTALAASADFASVCTRTF
jgi:hypothetical protein